METAFFVVLVAVVAVILAIVYHKTRIVLGTGLIVVGVLASMTGIGFFIGVPIVVVGAALLVLGYKARRALKGEPTTQRGTEPAPPGHPESMQ